MSANMLLNQLKLFKHESFLLRWETGTQLLVRNLWEMSHTVEILKLLSLVLHISAFILSNFSKRSLFLIDNKLSLHFIVSYPIAVFLAFLSLILLCLCLFCYFMFLYCFDDLWISLSRNINVFEELTGSVNIQGSTIKIARLPGISEMPQGSKSSKEQDISLNFISVEI